MPDGAATFLAHAVASEIKRKFDYFMELKVRPCGMYTCATTDVHHRAEAHAD